ncbi:hypothetical protein [Candidatus Cetobacterium colombiensis]|uniref:Uncharacterized protein n=1 Tax=Candidatus Cetobacterium colombiensis TaxID=3073100 RepID=A0ABU4W6Y3_9FUSO|nr:hypothetical protein [Candidatus Cetobacterium colombiensis]MDX8335283.1 hypothetical protein [Candidatus Cetobacterium colombiensis]
MENRIQERVAKVIENADILDKRAYFTVDCEGSIKRKEMNYTIPAMVFCKNDELFNENLQKECNKIERENQKKIDRLSNVEVETLKTNFVKLVIKGELEFAKKYGKELALRDKEEFLKTLFNLSLMDNINFNKPLMALAMKEILNTIGWKDEVGYLVISYFTKQRFDLNLLENLKETEEEVLNVPESLKLIAYKKVLDSYKYTKEKKYKAILLEEIKKNKEISHNEIENEILASLKF